MRYIVAYDIADPRRLHKVAKVMLDYGFRIQRSIFELELEDWQLDELQRRVAAIIEPVEDGVKFFRMCGRCVGLWYAVGTSLSDSYWAEDYVIL